MNALITDTKKVYAVWANTDLTKGRGIQRPIAFCELEATAKRFAKGANVQESDGDVTVEEFIRVNSIWYAPHAIGWIQCASLEDVQEEKRLEEQRRKKKLKEGALAKAKTLGLTDEEINALKG